MALYTHARWLLVALFLLALFLPCDADTQGHPGNNCDPGEYYDSSRGRCSDCPAGTFSGVSGSTTCCTCCAGYYQDHSGQSSCKKCPSNRPYSVPGATSSNQCRSGSGAANSCVQTNSQTCPPTGGGNPSPRAEKRRVGPSKYNDAVCPFGWRSCPVWGIRGKSGEAVFECVDIRRDLEACGGCVYNDSPFGERTAAGGRDCSAIPNVDEVRCEKGQCIIRECNLWSVQVDDGANRPDRYREVRPWVRGHRGRRSLPASYWSVGRPSLLQHR
ncbi:hypothetical protein C8Q70DRAFT_422783 [Cubamyces menziesii]|nr:hypothetical protein C8Q70DRAFT_422783 [Cubamyces menziesii]